jgi:hypothetical protein
VTASFYFKNNRCWIINAAVLFFKQEIIEKVIRVLSLTAADRLTDKKIFLREVCLSNHKLSFTAIPRITVCKRIYRFFLEPALNQKFSFTKIQQFSIPSQKKVS